MTSENASRYLIPKTLICPRKPDIWTIKALREHLQWAVDVEFFTIPFYMAAMYSIKDQTCEAARLVKSVVNQEMLHMQSAANIANAYGTNLEICAPQYGGSIPHLNFDLDKKDNPEHIYFPYSTAIGAFDVERLNAMCIIEYPEWGKHSTAPANEYGSIGELYESIKEGCIELKEHLVANNKQVNHFAGFYPKAQLTVTECGDDGLAQAIELINLIVDQGEGLAKKAPYVPEKFQNPADDIQPTWDHYEKFTYMLNQPLPETYELVPYGGKQKKLRDIQIGHFGEFLCIMNITFAQGVTPDDFAVVMYKNGAAIASCWQNGTLPVFSAS